MKQLVAVPGGEYLIEIISSGVFAVKVCGRVEVARWW